MGPSLCGNRKGNQGKSLPQRRALRLAAIHITPQLPGLNKDCIPSTEGSHRLFCMPFQRNFLKLHSSHAPPSGSCFVGVIHLVQIECLTTDKEEGGKPRAKTQRILYLLPNWI